jgi:hypothetical protein
MCFEKVKVNITLEQASMEQMYRPTLSLTSALDVVGGQCRAPTALPPERSHTHCIGGWVGPSASLDGYGKSHPPPGFNPWTVQPIVSYPSPLLSCCV